MMGLSIYSSGLSYIFIICGYWVNYSLFFVTYLLLFRNAIHHYLVLPCCAIKILALPEWLRRRYLALTVYIEIYGANLGSRNQGVW